MDALPSREMQVSMKIRQNLIQISLPGTAATPLSAAVSFAQASRQAQAKGGITR